MTRVNIIQWTPIPGSTGTKVEYRIQGSGTWLLPSSPANPTSNNNYPLTMTDGVYYDVRLTTIASFCGPRSITLQAFHPVEGVCCPPTYTLSPDQSYCFKITDTAATPPSNPQNTVAKTFNTYSAWGTLIYNTGFNVNGTGPFTQIPYTNAFWVNGPGYPTNSPGTFNGPLDRTGLWTSICNTNQTLGFTQCVTLVNDGIYYIGMGIDNFGTIKVDGVTIVNQDPVAMNAYLSANGYPLSVGFAGEITFRFWHVYPISLTAGNHILEVIGNNVTCPAAVGTEIYNATLSDLMAATSYLDLGAKLLFSTKDIIGQPVQVGSDGFGYSCPSGQSLVLCDGPAMCRQTLTTSTISC